MSNFFAALGDSDDEKAPVAVNKKKESKKPTVVEPSKVPVNPRRNEKAHTSGGRGRGRGRGGGGGRRGREFDRKSGTGRGKEVKKKGGGAHNWGSDQTAAQDVAAATQDNVKEEQDDKNVDEVVEVEPEPEDNTMTLAEYQAQKKAVVGGDTAGAAAGRTMDTSEFAGKVAAKKQEEDYFGTTGGKSKKSKKKNAEKQESIAVGFRVASGEEEGGGGRGRGGGGRGRGRGGGRGRGRSEEGEGRGGRGGGRGRGRGRGGRGGEGRSGRGGRGRGGRGRGASSDTTPNFQDPGAFPSL